MQLNMSIRRDIGQFIQHHAKLSAWKEQVVITRSRPPDVQFFSRGPNLNLLSPGGKAYAYTGVTNATASAPLELRCALEPSDSSIEIGHSPTTLNDPVSDPITTPAAPITTTTAPTTAPYTALATASRPRTGPPPPRLPPPASHRRRPRSPPHPRAGSPCRASAQSRHTLPGEAPQTLGAAPRAGAPVARAPIAGASAAPRSGSQCRRHRAW